MKKVFHRETALLAVVAGHPKPKPKPKEYTFS